MESTQELATRVNVSFASIDKKQKQLRGNVRWLLVSVAFCATAGASGSEQNWKYLPKHTREYRHKESWQYQPKAWDYSDKKSWEYHPKRSWEYHPSAQPIPIQSAIEIIAPLRLDRTER